MAEPAPLKLQQWAAWAPGFSSSEDWLAWAHGAAWTAGEQQAPASKIPAMLRRRAQSLGRMALEAISALPATPTSIVYCSRHGELQRSADLLVELAATGALSPQSFSMAVHNAIMGLQTIATGNHANVIAVAGGKAGALCGLVEVLGLLADGESRVRLVVCEEGLPELYREFADEPAFAYAYALEFSLTPSGDAEAVTFSVQCAARGAEPISEASAGLGLLRFLIGAERHWQFVDQRSCWTLRKNG